MKLSKDKTLLAYNDFLTISGIPEKVYDYRLGNRSTLEWIINQYCVKIDKRSGIVNDPNRAEDPQYIVKLIGKVITVSLETVKVMETLMYRYYIYTIAIILTCIPAAADNTDIHENAGTRAMTFLKIGVGAKAIGMGESQVATTDDLYASYWNPAGLARLQKPQLALMHNEWFADINHEFVGVALPLGSIGTVGASASYLSFGELQGRDRDGNETTIFRPYDLALILSYARNFGSSLAFGTNAKFLREQIADETGTGIAFDLGALYTFPDMPLSLGVNAQHLGPRVTFIEEAFGLPVTMRLGAAYKLANDALTLTTDIIRPSDNDIAIGIGAGYTIGNILQLRTGYKYQIGGNDLGAVSGLRGGFGLTLRQFQIDYALVPFGVLGLTHRFSLLASF